MKLLLLATVSVAALLSGAVAARETFACNAKALTAEERRRHHDLSQSVFGSVRERTELPDGYGFRLPPDQLVPAAEWVSMERRCCPFLAFVLEQSRDQGALWLRVTGAPGVKAFIAAELAPIP